MPASRLQLLDRALEVRDAVDEDRPLALQMPGKQDPRRLVAEPHHRDARAERLDRKLQAGAEHLGEVLDVGRDVRARHVDEVEAARMESARDHPWAPNLIDSLVW